MEPQREKKRNALIARKRKLLSLTNEVTDLKGRLLEFGVKEVILNLFLSLGKTISAEGLLEFGVKEVILNLFQGKTISAEGSNFLKDGTAEKEEEECFNS
ncbi:hypothetical protein QE152_g26378 [Popillia japonica]|uniref:BZIP domain-containing protein n=1 Tax=Popillia japonica TaxID=7064 RepID=A0AAW1JYN4_POPJA